MKLIIIIVCMFFITNVALAMPVKLSKYPKVYKGDEGIIVTVIPIVPKSEKQALIAVTGYDTELDGLVLRYDLINQGQNEVYRMIYNGRESYRLRTRQGFWLKATTLHLPDTRENFDLTYDEELSKKVIVDEFLTRYLDGEKQGLQEEIAQFKRQSYITENQETFDEAIRGAEKDCGAVFAGNIHWETLSDEQIRTLAIGSSYCGAPFDQISRFCRRSEENKSLITGAIKSVNCSMGNQMKVRLNDKELTWITAEDGNNQDDFIFYFLLNEVQ